MQLTTRSAGRDCGAAAQDERLDGREAGQQRDGSAGPRRPRRPRRPRAPRARRAARRAQHDPTSHCEETPSSILSLEAGSTRTSNKHRYGEYSTLRPACWAPVGSPFPGLCGFPIALAAHSGGTSAGRPSRGQRVGPRPPPPRRDTCMEGAPWAVPRRRTGSQELRVTPRFSFPCIRDDNHTHSGPGPLLPNSEVRSQGS